MIRTSSVLAATILGIALLAACAGPPAAPGESAEVTVDAPVDAVPADLSADEQIWLASLGSECGNGSCEPPEDCNTCPGDCGGCCGNHKCEPPEDCKSCPGDCGGCCGDYKCEAPEDCNSCPGDCGPCQ